MGLSSAACICVILNRIDMMFIYDVISCIHKGLIFLFQIQIKPIVSGRARIVRRMFQYGLAGVPSSALVIYTMLSIKAGKGKPCFEKGKKPQCDFCFDTNPPPAKRPCLHVEHRPTPNLSRQSPAWSSSVNENSASHLSSFEHQWVSSKHYVHLWCHIYCY